MSLLRLKTGEPAPARAAEIFGRVLPQVLSHEAEACRRLGGRYAFALSGDGGGAWTLDYPAATVRDGVLDDADVVVAMPERDFRALVKGTLDVEAAARTGRVRVRGDRALLKNLVSILVRPR